MTTQEELTSDPEFPRVPIFEFRFRVWDFIGQNSEFDSESETLHSEEAIPIPRPIPSPELKVLEFQVQLCFFTFKKP